MNDTNIVTRLRELTKTLLLGDFRGLSETTASAADEIERLRAERDEARRKICEMEAECIVYPPCSPQQYAIRMDWDCFKENTNG